MNERPDRYQDAIHRSVKNDRSRVVRGGGNPRIYSGGDVPTEESVTLRFDINGDFTDSEDETVAKRLHTENGVRCYVLVSKTGYNIGHILDPCDIYFKKGDVARSNSKLGRHNYDFRKVTEIVFDDYMRYLKTKLTSYFRSADQQVLNA